MIRPNDSKRPQVKRLVMVFFVVFSLGALFIYGFKPRDERDIASPRIGKTLDDFTAPVFERYTAEYGATLNYADLLALGKPLVVNVWAEWCYPACWNEAPRLQAAWETHRRQITMLGIDFQDDEAKADAFLDRFRYTFPSVKDPRGVIGISWGVFGVPETYFIAADGTLNYKHNGEISAETLETQIDALLKQR